MNRASAFASLAFASIGHAYAHLFEPIFYVVALVLPTVFGLPYEEALALIVAGKLIYGLAAPFVGWLGDRWSTVGMMALYFLGLGVAAMVTGLARTPMEMALALALLGFFGSIYHPVGIAWLVRNADNPGKAIGINGVFGGLGPAVGSALGAALIAGAGWRWAFLAPGAVVAATGLLFLWLVWRGVVVETKTDRKPQPPASRGDTLRVGLVLSLTMLCAGLIYQSTQPALPKLFSDRLDGASVGAAGMAVTIVYVIAGLGQVVAGHLADRFPPRLVYVVAYALQVPLLYVAATASGLPLVLVAVMMVSLNMAGIPAENVLLARYTPARWRGTAFGLKFVLAFGVSGLGVPLVAYIRGSTGDFYWLFALLAVMASVVAAAGLLLPGEKPAPVPVPAE
ncbi:MAG: MFS transporter [Alphaproteobacteria bacterium]|nr:MFS transporter [Alphaproteobacteria bacterium]